MGRSLPGKGESMREKWNQTTEKQFDSLIQSNEIVLVDFCGEGCYPCAVLSPVVDRLAEKYENLVRVAKVDVNREEELAGRFDIQGIPTVLIFKNGQIIAQEVGILEQSIYEDILDANLPEKGQTV